MGVKSVAHTVPGGEGGVVKRDMQSRTVATLGQHYVTVSMESRLS